MVSDRATLGATGAYTAERACALSGVPLSTIHYWARNNILVPSVAQEKIKLWSYSDLLGLRTIYWLRNPKTAADGRDIPPTTMTKVRRALDALRMLEVSLWEEDVPRVMIDHTGHIFVRTRDHTILDGVVHNQTILPGYNLIEPMDIFNGARGPDLSRPRPSLCILPGKLSGSPHVAQTRLETAAIAALHRRNYSPQKIRSLYPFVGNAAIQDAIDLEEQLEHNLRPRAA